MKHACRRMKHFAALPQNMKHRRCGMKQSLFRLYVFLPLAKKSKHRQVRLSVNDLIIQAATGACASYRSGSEDASYCAAKRSNASSEKARREVKRGLRRMKHFAHSAKYEAPLARHEAKPWRASLFFLPEFGQKKWHPHRDSNPRLFSL